MSSLRRDTLVSAARLPLRSHFIPLSRLAADDRTLGAVFFGERMRQLDPALSLTVSMPQLGGEELAEVWIAEEPLRRVDAGALSLAVAGDVAFGVMTIDRRLPLADATRLTYLEMVQSLRELGFPCFLRIWNHVARINDDSSGLERYREFSLGRHEAFAALGYALRSDLPAASAVGMTGDDDLAVHFIASREPGEQVENPRQVSAFSYPPEYGPRSPSFSRGTVKRWSGGAQLFLSGTASIIGHQTVHHDDLVLQLEETLTNMRAVIGEAERRAGVEPVGLAALRTVKTYVRHRADAELLGRRIREEIPGAELLFLQADICRRDLLLEIEGLAEWKG